MSPFLPNEETYRVLFEDNPSMYFAVDGDGTVLSVNRFGAQRLGYEVDDLLGQPVTGVFFPDDREAVIEQLAACCATPGEAFEWELRKVTRQGSLMWVHEHARAVQTSDGRTIVLIVCEDITDQRRTSEALRESRERYRTLYARTPAMLHSIDADYKLVDVSEHWLERLGYERSEVIGRPVTDFVTESYREIAETRHLLELMTTDSVRDLGYQLVTKQGEVLDILLSSIAECDGKGQFVRSLAVLVDVTEQTRAEAALFQAHGELEQRVEERTAELEKQRAFLRQVLDINPNLIFAKDREGRFSLVNEAVADAYGTTVEDLVGRTDRDFNSNEEEVEFFRRMDLEVMDTLQERFIPEETITDAHGRTRWLQTVKRPIVGPDGRAEHVLGAATDITARREAELRLRESETALRQSERELRALAGKLLSAQEEERRRLAREIHDDFSQRLAGLALHTGRLAQQLGRSEQDAAGDLAKIHRELERLSGDVHALSRQLHPSILEDLGLEDALRSECESFSERTGVAVSFASGPLPTSVSKQVGIGIYRIAQEALNNVARHAQTSRASVSLQGTEGEIALVVQDLGAGFDPACPKRTRGIGLASMEERARLIQADLIIDAAPGRGTRVILRVPIQPRDDAGELVTT